MRKIRIKSAKRSPGIFLIISLIAILTYLLGWSSLFSVHSLDIQGTQRTGEIQSVISNDSAAFRIGEPLARVDVHALSRRISLLNWIEAVNVNREWLHGKIRISIQERTPLAQFSDEKGNIQLIDKNGKVFTSQTASNLPIITFATTSTELLPVAASFVQSLPLDLLNNLQAISIRSEDFIQSSHSGLGNGVLIIRWGTNSDISTKVKVLRALLALPENAKARLIDLSSPLSPIAK